MRPPNAHSHNNSSCTAHAGHPVRCGFSVQSRTSLEYWGHPPSRVMTFGGDGASHSFAISPQVCARFSRISRLLKIRGRGECRVPNAPAASCALCSWSMHTSIHSGGTGNIRHSPRNGFNSLYRALPGDRALLPPSFADRSANLTPASGCQDHTTSPSASSAFVSRAISVHRIPRSTSVTIAKRPSVGRDDSLYSCFYPAVKRKFWKSEVII
jgi:hypothetical protein